MAIKSTNEAVQAINQSILLIITSLITTLPKMTILILHNTRDITFNGITNIWFDFDLLAKPALLTNIRLGFDEIKQYLP